ncbi:MAG TPA: ATP-binding protein [Rickettsiales bacterium]|nr:ATP-binding protein [Rickettsiales bacterium]
MKRYEDILQLMPAALYTTDKEGTLTFYNNAAAELWEKRPEIGKTKWHQFASVYTPEGVELPWQQHPFSIALAEKRPVRGVEVALKHCDGTLVPVLPHPTPMYEEDGSFAGALNMLVDISARKETETMLKRRNKWLRLLAEFSAELGESDDPRSMMERIFQKASMHIQADIFLNYDVADNETLPYLKLYVASGEYTSVTGVARLEFGQDICGTVAQTHAPIIINDFQNHPSAKSSRLYGMGIYAYICQPLISNGELIGTVSFGKCRKSGFEQDEIEFIQTIAYYVAVAKRRLRDEKARKRSEIYARKNAKRAERANRAKSEFLANMSHDVRTPANAILGLTSILEKQTVSPQQYKKIVKTLHLSTQTLLELVNNLLDFSQIEGGYLELDKKPFDLEQLLTEIIEVNGVQAQKKNISLQIEYLAHPDRLVVGDPLRLKQVLMNLTNNAVKFTEQGGVKLTVDCRNAGDDHINIRMEVADTGIGIKEKQLPHIFERFVQANSHVAQKYGGAGLGLAITKKLLEAMGGTIQVRSEFGKGTCFTIDLTLQTVHGAKVLEGAFSQFNDMQHYLEQKHDAEDENPEPRPNFGT